MSKKMTFYHFLKLSSATYCKPSTSGSLWSLLWYLLKEAESHMSPEMCVFSTIHILHLGGNIFPSPSFILQQSSVGNSGRDTAWVGTGTQQETQVHGAVGHRHARTNKCVVPNAYHYGTLRVRMTHDYIINKWVIFPLCEMMLCFGCH